MAFPAPDRSDGEDRNGLRWFPVLVILVLPVLYVGSFLCVMFAVGAGWLDLGRVGVIYRPLFWYETHQKHLPGATQFTRLVNKCYVSGVNSRTP